MKLTLDRLEQRDVPAAWPFDTAYFPIDTAAYEIHVAGPGGGPRVQVRDQTFGLVLADFFAFEDTFRGGVFVALEGDELKVGSGIGGAPVQAVYDLTQILGGIPVELSRQWMGDPAARDGFMPVAKLPVAVLPEFVRVDERRPVPPELLVNAEHYLAQVPSVFVERFQSVGGTITLHGGVQTDFLARGIANVRSWTIGPDCWVGQAISLPHELWHVLTTQSLSDEEFAELQRVFPDDLLEDSADGFSLFCRNGSDPTGYFGWLTSRWSASSATDFADGIVAYYPLDGTAEDVSGKGRNLNGVLGFSGSDGILGTFAREGTGSFAVPLSLTAATVSYWFQFTGQLFDPGYTLAGFRSEQGVLLGGESQNANRVFKPHVLGVGELGVAALSTGVWHHAVVVGDAGSVRVYVDKVLVVEIQGIAPLDSELLSIEVPRGSRAVIDEVGLWSRALTEVEVSALWNNGVGLNPFS